MDNLIEKWEQHGIDVNKWYNKLLDNPDVINNPEVISWFNSYVPIEGIENYHYHHDIGKPYCIVYDESGKPHYPNHSQVSYNKYIEKFGDDGFADMILHDMDFHLAKGDEIKSVWKLPYSDHLYATAWAELYSNAEIFGGLESDSFKIKRKRLIKALKCVDKI